MIHRTVLIAGNSKAERAFALKTLSGAFGILEPDTFAQAYDLLRDSTIPISVLLLCINSCDEEALHFLKDIYNNATLYGIPTVVLSNHYDPELDDRVRSIGAIDYLGGVTDIKQLKRHVAQAARQQELNAPVIRNKLIKEIRYQLDHDELTGIYSLPAFCRATEHMIHFYPNRAYMIVRWDIEKFKLVNEMCGVKSGDALLCAAAHSLSVHLHSKGTFGRLGPASFAMCLVADKDNVLIIVDSIIKDLRIAFKEIGLEQLDLIDAGVYLIEDRNIPVNTMCDRAGMALQTIRDDFSKHVAFLQ